jgi:glycerol kinase
MGKYIMSFDAGTTSSRCILFNENGEVCSKVQKEFTQYFPRAGWVEHDASEIWQTQLSVARKAMQEVGATYKDITAIGITNQRETTVVWDKKTGTPICNAIVWQSRQSLSICEKLSKKETIIHNKTMQIICPFNVGLIFIKSFYKHFFCCFSGT